MPRMTNEELIAAEERKLEEAKAKAQERIDAAIAKTEARLAELKAKAEERQTTRLQRIDELIVGAKDRVAKAQAYLDKLSHERDELSADEQPSLPAEDEHTETEESADPVIATKRGRRQSDAA